MSDADLRDRAEHRRGLHVDHPTHRPLSPDYEKIGLAGEVAFAEATGQEVDWTDRLGGDGGRDFVLPLSIDIKTFCDPQNLLVESGKANADIYVLTHYNDGNPVLLGWEWGLKIARVTPRNFGRGVINHYVPRGELKQIDRLVRAVRKRNG